MNTPEYFQLIEQQVKKSYDLARVARGKGLDPVSDVETPIAMSLAEKVIGLISTIYPQLNDLKIVNRILELEKEYGQLDMAVSLKIAEEIAKEKFCKFESLLQAMDAGVRVGFAYTTLGVVSSPIEGFTELKIGKTNKGEEYIIAYFSGPIRSAGTTASCVVLMIVDYLRETFGFARYDPDEQEVKRYITENYDYHERVTNLQYLPTEEEIAFLAKNIPIQINGDPTEDREVSNYKDLPRIETNFIRGGMCLIFSEGLAQKAQKGLRLLRGAQAKGFKATGWEFLDEYVALHKKREKGSSDSSPTYIKDLVAGRPVFSHPSRSGGFRFRYGRGRVGGFSATAVHPATMAISDSFLSFGTQLKIEKPTKGCAITICDEIDGPIVRLKNGSVKRVWEFETARKLYSQVDEILYFGDILVSFGDVANRNYELLKPGYVEEWWMLELKKASEEGAKGINPRAVSFEQARDISQLYGIPLHPKYVFYWKEISFEQFFALLQWIASAQCSPEGKIILPYYPTERVLQNKGKRALELIGCEHEVTLDNVVIEPSEAQSLCANIGLELGAKFNACASEILSKVQTGEVLTIVNALASPFIIKDKSGTYIGARMGRPEKAKLRELIGSPHAIFPVGEEGGRLRSVQVAVEHGSVHAEAPIYECKTCNHETIYPRCETCGSTCLKLYYSSQEDKIHLESSIDGKALLEYREQSIDIKRYFDLARKRLGLRNEEIPLVKGIRGTSSKGHSCELLTKGILRAKHRLNVNKDGTIRYDMTEMAITHFKPREVGTSVEKLRELGYSYDWEGAPLEHEDQVLIMFPHDVILPACTISGDEPADAVFLRITQFVDDELEYLYGLPRFFNAKKTQDLIGILVVNIAPHICTATVGRLIGFSRNQTLLASPFMHAAMRRDCDGDEAATLLLMDLLLNFSRKFLPAHRGGTQDAPLVLNVQIRAGDVDDQILDFELGSYPLELYQLAEQGKHSSEVKMDNVKARLKSGKDPFTGIRFTHGCADINYGVLNSSYKILPTMQEKVDAMMKLCDKIRAVDQADVARLIIERHFIRDTRGNLRKFSMQAFRCVGCNDSYRRPPLTGKCTSCGGRLIFTISEGSILKYMQPALDLARRYNVSPYLIESLELNQMYIESIFGRDSEKQETINKWF